MALDSPISFNTTLSPHLGPNLTIPDEALSNYGGEAVNRVGQLGLNQRITKLGKTSLPAKKSVWFRGRVNVTENAKVNKILRALSPTLLDYSLDTESIIKTSQIIRAQLVHAASSFSVSKEAVADTQEKRKAREMLQAQLLRASALAPRNEVVACTSKPTSQDMLLQQLVIAPSITHRLTLNSPLKKVRLDYPILNSGGDNSSHPRFSRPIADIDHEGTSTLCPYPLSVCFGYETSENNTLQNVINVGEAINLVENISESDNNYDGRLHSYPYKKNGPYTCPKCRHVFETSQRFAAHVSSSHYKYETKSERKKRLMAKVRGRALRLRQINDELTIVPDNVTSTGNDNVASSPVRMKVEGTELVEVERGVEVPLAPPPGMKKLTTAELGTEGFKIKLEFVDE